MVFAGKDYVKVLDQFIDREVLPQSIVPGGRGRVALGMPPLIGDAESDSYQATSLPQKTVADYAVFGRAPSTASLGESENASASSTEISLFDGSVLIQTLVKGHWMESEKGSLVFASRFAQLRHQEGN
jgi:hypothetical protein